MRLSDVLRADLTLTDLSARDRDAVLWEISERLATRGVVPDPGPVAAALIAREDAHPTAMGNRMAIPHTAVDGLPSPLLMVATSTESVPFGAPAGEEEEAQGVRAFFVILTPPEGRGEHVRLLARICRLARHGELVEAILAASAPGEVVDTLLRLDREDP